MCRIAARVGPPAPLSLPLSGVPWSLTEQAYAPRELRSGHVNVDGTGVVWFEEPADDGPVDAGPARDPRPLRYRTPLPPWGDQVLVELAPRLRSSVVLAAVRSTTPGLPHGTAFVHPFTAGPIAGTHNGWIEDYRRRVARPLLAELSDEAFAGLDGSTDAAALVLLAADGYAAGEGLLGAAVRATEIAARVCERVGATATLTLVLADADGVAAVNAAVGRPANSLYTAVGRAGGDDAVARWLASEPVDPDLDWTPVPPGGTAHLTRQELSTTCPT